MTWVGSFQSLQSALPKPRFTGDPLEVHTWLRSEIALISPFVDWLMSLRSIWARVRFFADHLPASNSRTCSAAARSQ